MTRGTAPIEHCQFLQLRLSSVLSRLDPSSLEAKLVLTPLVYTGICSFDGILADVRYAITFKKQFANSVLPHESPYLLSRQQFTCTLSAIKTVDAL